MKFSRVLFLLFASLFSLFACSEDEQIENPTVFIPKTRLMIVPDIQNYTDKEDRFKYLHSIVDYYELNKDSIEAILQVGDLTNNNKLWQYENAYNEFFYKFDDTTPMAYCLGNHDYGNNGSSDIRMSNLPSHMMMPDVVRMNGTSYDNYVKYISIAGKRYGVLVLEFATRNETLEWANSIVKNDLTTPYILLIHVFLNGYGQMFDYTDPLIKEGGSHKQYKMGDDYKNDSKEIFDKLIYNNSNIKLVVCGHCLTPDYINVSTKENSIGKPVHMIMVNYQHYNNGGMGFIGLLDIAGDSYRIRSFCTYENRYGTKDISFGGEDCS